MNGYLNYLVAKEHVSDLMADASRRRLRDEIKRSGRGSSKRAAPDPMPAVYCQRAAGSGRRALA